MRKLLDAVKQVDINLPENAALIPKFTGCIVITHDDRILLQERPLNWRTFPGMIATFGGKIDSNETPVEALVRELNEELGANADPADIIELGALTEAVTDHKEIAFLYYWHDKENTITGCYECDPIYFQDTKDALAHPKLTDDVIWALMECELRKLI